MDLDQDQEKILKVVQEHGQITTKEAKKLIEKKQKNCSEKVEIISRKKVLHKVATLETDPTGHYELKS